MRNTRLTLPALVLATSLPMTASAEVQFNGFASIVAGMAVNEPAPEAAAESLGNVYDFGYDEDISFDQDSIFALQARSDLGDGLSVTGLLYAEGKNDYEAEFFAAYLSYQVNDQWRVNVGRIPWPLFQYTDFLDVGYAYPWISPPTGVYGIATGNNIDGVTAIYNRPISDWDMTVQFHSDLDVINGVKATFVKDWLTFNATYVNNSETTIPLFFETAASLASQGYAQQGEDLVMRDDSTDFMAVGFNIDYNNWLFVGEYALVDFDPGWFSDVDSYYLTAGHRFGDLMLHVTYDVQDEDPQLEFTQGLPTGGAPLLVDWPFGPPGTQVPVSVVETFARGRAQEHENWIIGARYDFHPSAALKVEYLMNEVDDGDAVSGVKEFDTDIMRVGVELVF